MSETTPLLTSFTTQRNNIHHKLRILIRNLWTQVDQMTLEEIATGLNELAHHVESLKHFTDIERTSPCFEVKCTRITTYLTDYSEQLHTRPDTWQEVADVLDMVLIQVGRLTLAGENSDVSLAQDAEMLAEDKEIDLLPRVEDETASRNRRYMYGLWWQLTYSTVVGCFCKGCREDMEWNGLDEIEESSQDGEDGEGEEEELSGSSRTVLRVANP